MRHVLEPKCDLVSSHLDLRLNSTRTSGYRTIDLTGTWGSFLSKWVRYHFAASYMNGLNINPFQKLSSLCWHVGVNIRFVSPPWLFFSFKIIYPVMLQQPKHGTPYSYVGILKVSPFFVATHLDLWHLHVEENNGWRSSNFLTALGRGQAGR